MQHLMKKSLIALGITMAASSVSVADTWDISITNLTYGNHFTPLLVTAHAHDKHLFEVGMEASVAMEHMAECGHLQALEGETVTADTVSNPASGFLSPGSNTTAQLVDPAGTHLSVVSMILPTNDAFMGLESQHIPDFDATEGASNTHVFWVNGYDAGTENNDEILAAAGSTCSYQDTGMMPGAPGGNAGSGGSGVELTADRGVVHIHRGVLGDDDLDAGKSDLVNTIHRWQNPVAKIVVVVTKTP